MAYPCPIPECDGGPFERKIDQTSHLRMKNDEEHNRMHRRLNEVGTPMEEVEGETNDANGSEGDESPELSETFEQKYNGGETDETDDGTDEVLEFGEVDETSDSNAPEGFRELDESSDLEKELADEFSWIEKGSKPVQKKEVRR